jgi:hypothetical protein
MRFSWKPLKDGMQPSISIRGTPPLGLMRFSWKQCVCLHPYVRAPPLGLMRFSWKPTPLGSFFAFKICSLAPPLGLMRFSWKHLGQEEQLPSHTPPLGLMRFSWKLFDSPFHSQRWGTPPLGLMRFSWKPISPSLLPSFIRPPRLG